MAITSNIKKNVELDVRMQKIIDEEFADFENYLPSIQDRKMYDRKRKEYWNKITVRIKEELTDGRTDNGNAIPTAGAAKPGV